MLQPKLSRDQSREIASILLDESTKNGIAWQLLVSIAFHESSLGMSMVNHKSKDYGLMQINIRNIEKMGHTENQVKKDLRLSVRLACKILKYNRQVYADRYPFWLGIYRSGTALNKEHIRANAKSYDHMIRKTAAMLGYRSVFTQEYYGKNDQ